MCKVKDMHKASKENHKYNQSQNKEYSSSISKEATWLHGYQEF